MKKRWIVLIVVSALIIGSLLTIKLTNTQLILTGHFSSDTLFRVKGRTCQLSEGKIYLANTVYGYEELYGKELFDQDFNGVDSETFFKENVLGRLSKIKVLNNLAEKWEVTLTKEEKEAAKKAASAYYKELGEKKTKELGTSEKQLTLMYEEYALAKKAFEFFTSSSNIEVSEDEARVIVVWHMFFKTYERDEKGEVVSVSEKDKATQYQKAQNVLGMLKEGADFATLAENYSEDEKVEYSIGRGEMPEAFDKAAFNLEEGQVSEIVETPYGYHIIKCISDFEKRETAQNKKKILKEKQNEEFEKIYESYIGKLSVNVNTGKWDKVTLRSVKDIKTKSFFTIYDEYFGALQ